MYHLSTMTTRIRMMQPFLLMAFLLVVPTLSECPGGDQNHLLPPIISTWKINFTYAWAGECCVQELPASGICMSACIINGTCWHGDNPYITNKTCVEDWGGAYHHLASCMALGYDPGKKDFTTSSTASVMLGPKIPNPGRVNYTNQYITPCPAAQVIPDYIENGIGQFPHDWAGQCCGQNVSYDGVCMSSCVLTHENECWQGDNPYLANITCTEWGGVFYPLDDCAHWGYGGGRKTFDETSDVGVFVGPRFLPEPTVSPAPTVAAPVVAPNAPVFAPTALMNAPSTSPSMDPSSNPSAIPSFVPSVEPSVDPSSLPSSDPSNEPSVSPSSSPSTDPSASPSLAPSGTPSKVPSPPPKAAPVSPAPSAFDVHQEILDLLDDLYYLADTIPSSHYKQASLENMLKSKINLAIDDVQMNDYSAAVNEVNTYIAPRMDGCANSGFADTGDWVTNCSAQASLNAILDDILYHLNL